MTQLIVKVDLEPGSADSIDHIIFLDIVHWSPDMVGSTIVYGSLDELMPQYKLLQKKPPLYIALKAFDTKFLNEYSLLQKIAPLLYISNQIIYSLNKMFSGVILWLDAGEQFLWHKFNIAEIFQFIRFCKQQNLLVGLAAPFASADIARMLPYAPDFLLIERVLLEEAANLLAYNADVSVLKKDQLMRIYVRDYILDMDVGVYAHEYGVKQRICFNVVAEVLAPRASPGNMVDIFSYDIILDAILDLVTHNHIDFVETLADMLCSRLLQHQLIQSIQVRVEKLDLAPKAVGIEIKRTKVSSF